MLSATSVSDSETHHYLLCEPLDPGRLPMCLIGTPAASEERPFDVLGIGSSCMLACSGALCAALSSQPTTATWTCFDGVMIASQSDMA